MDQAAVYERARQRVIDLAKNTDVSAPVPACPGWTVKDVVAHLGALLGTFIENDPEQLQSPTRNDEQVAARKDWTLEECITEWEENARNAGPVFESRFGTVAVSDVLSHEQDIRAAANLPGHRDEEGVVPSIEMAIGFIQQKIADEELPALRIVTDDIDTTIGDGEAAVTLRTSTFELFRTLLGRRSARQISALDWDGDPGPWAKRLFIFGPAESDITE